jgi:hypothetical protein
MQKFVYAQVCHLLCQCAVTQFLAPCKGEARGACAHDPHNRRTGKSSRTDKLPNALTLPRNELENEIEGGINIT